MAAKIGNDPTSGRVTCDRCPYPRDGGECLRRQGVPGAGGSFGDYCECACHVAKSMPPSPEFFGVLGRELDKLSTDQLSYERYAAERTIEVIDAQIELLEFQKANEFRRYVACDAILIRRRR